MSSVYPDLVDEFKKIFEVISNEVDKIIVNWKEFLKPRIELVES